MGRFLKECLSTIVEECENKPYEYWKKFEFDSCFEREFQRKTVQVEIHLLENTEDYLNISISIDRRFGLRSFFPQRRNFIVQKQPADNVSKSETNNV